MKLMGPLASFIIASSSSFFTLRRPEWGEQQELELDARDQSFASHKIISAHSFFFIWAGGGRKPLDSPQTPQPSTFMGGRRELTHGCKGVPEILFVNNAISVLVNYSESLWRGRSGDT